MTQIRLRFPRFILTVALSVAVIFGILYLLDAKMKPVVVAASSTLANRVGSEALTGALTDVIEKHADNDHLFATYPLQSGSDMTITRMDVSYLTQLQARAAEEATDRLENLSRQTIRLPLFSMYSGSLLSRSTLTIPVRIHLLGAVHTSIESDVSSRGVNQVVHIISIHETAEVMVITPFVSKPTHIDAKSPVVYIVMSGPVPHF